MYEQLFERHAELLKALSNSRRLEIIHLLRDQEMCVSDIFAMLDLPQANISQHLSVLREAGVVTSRRDGKQIYYQISHPNISHASDLLRQVMIERIENPDVSQAMKQLMKHSEQLVRDPVCGMRVSPQTAAFHTTHNNHDYFFCASGCYQNFTQEPDHYVHAK